MKKNITTVLWILAILIVLLGGYKLIHRSSVVPLKTSSGNDVRMKSFSGSITRVFEGDNNLAYSFDVPEYASTSVDMDNALVTVMGTSSPYATVYVSYEGGRGLSPVDYIDGVVAPHVSVINLTGTSTIGVYEWQSAETEGSEWHVTSINNGEWLIVVSNKKPMHDLVEKTLESFSTK